MVDSLFPQIEVKTSHFAYLSAFDISYKSESSYICLFGTIAIISILLIYVNSEGMCYSMSLRRKSILLGVAFGIYFSLYFVATDEQVYFSSIIIKTSMGICELSYDGIIQITMSCFPILIYLIVFGTDIYRHFCTASAYVLPDVKIEVNGVLRRCGGCF